VATVAQLAARAYQEVAYLFVVEGWPVAFSNRVEICGSGLNSWIDPADDNGRSVVLGLEPPASVKLGIGILESGMLTDDGLSLTIVDRDGHLVELMEDDDGTLLHERVPPTSPAPATVVNSAGDNATVWGAWVNGEAIGAAGERRQYPVLPGATLPGLDHPAIASEDNTLRASKVRSSARWLEGLPCALYLIRKDVAAGTWPDWGDQYDSGYSLIWWGSLRSVTAESVAWTLQCDGPSSWLRKTMNVAMPAEWRSVESLLVLGDTENRMASAFSFQTPLGNDEGEACGTSAYAAGDALTSGQTPAELATQINTRLQTIIATAGTDATFSTAPSLTGTAKMHDEGVTIRVLNNTASTSGYTLAGVLQLRMHMKAWLHLGWDLSLQGTNLNKWAVRNTPHELATEVKGDTFYPLKSVGGTSDWGSNYWEAVFTTVPLKADIMIQPTIADGDGATRTYEPLYKHASVTILDPDAQQTIALGFEDGRYNIGQLQCPPADVTVAGGAADRAGFIVVRGPWRESIDAEPTTLYQLARISWRDTSDTMGTSSNITVAWLEEWLDGQYYGCADPKLADSWAVRQSVEEGVGVQWCPIALVGYNAATHLSDRADLVLLRLLLSSGTAAWTGVGDDATIADGDNDHALATGGSQWAGNDLEVADLGLCIPQSMVDWQSFVDAADSLPGAKGGPLNRTRLAYIGPFDSQECIESILAPRGWCFSLRDGQYGIFGRHVPLDVEDVEVALDETHVAADPDATPPAERVDFRPLEPVDLVTVKYGESKLGGDSRAGEMTVKARDPRAAARKGNAAVEVDGTSLVPPHPGAQNPPWADDFKSLWGDHLARFYGEPHALVTVAIKGDTARDLWPGTIVSYSSDWPATRNGVYGMTSRVGRVVSTSLDSLTLAKTCEILVEGKDPLIQKRFGPIAALVNDHTTVETRYNAATRTLYCQADAFGRGGSATDVAAFAEPSWSTTGGNLICGVWASYNGVDDWEQTATFYVESVNTATNTIVHTAAYGLDGDLPENRYCIILPVTYDAQNGDEWPRAIFGVTCGVDEKHSAGNVAGSPWLE
jgi:hypothetical protein